jgi:hypothetical protein
MPGCSRMAQARFSGPRGSAPQFSANAVDENAADKAINAKMILTVTITGLVSISAGPNGYPCARGDRRNTARTAPSVMATMARGWRDRSRGQPLRDKFLVHPMTAVVASPNLSAHQPAGNGASGNDDRPQMPSPCPCGALAQSKGEANGCHRFLL